MAEEACDAVRTTQVCHPAATAVDSSSECGGDGWVVNSRMGMSNWVRMANQMVIVDGTESGVYPADVRCDGNKREFRLPVSPWMDQ